MNKHLTLVFALALAAPAHGQVLTLDDALREADAKSPRLAARQQAATAAQEDMRRAGELPDPKLRFGLENLPVTGADRFRYDRDFMTMRTIGVTQDFSPQSKLDARGARAARARDVALAEVNAQKGLLHRDTALAWFELNFAERTRAALEAQARQVAAHADAAQSSVLRGRQSAADSIGLRLSVEQVRDRVLDQERMIERARAMLTGLIGDAGRRPLAAAPDMSRPPHARETLIGRLQEHLELQVLDMREALARAEADVARSSKLSDISVEVGYSQRRPAFDNMLTVMVAIDLPWRAERRQDRDIAARLAEVDQARAQREDVRRMHEAELRGWLADHEAASRRIERYRNSLLPLAKERLDAALSAYRGGRGELAPVLQAQRGITETELALIAVEAEQAKAWANLSYLYPHEAPR